MHNILRIAGNNIRRILKKKSGILVYVILPPALAVLFMILVSSGETADIKLGIVDEDGTASSAIITRYLENSDRYSISMYEKGELDRAVVERQVRAGIFIPDGFEDYLSENGEQVKIGIYALEGAAVTGWLNAYVEQKTSILAKAGEMLGDSGAYTRVITNYEDKYARVESREVLDESNKMSGTRAGFGMYAFASLFGIWSICALGFREKVNKTYQRIMSGPVTPWTYAAGNTLATFFFAALHTSIAFLMVYNLFGIGQVIPAGEFALLMAFFYIAAISLGFLLMSLGRSESAVMAVNVVILTLTSMLGGCYWPVEFMPEAMQKMSKATIQYWFTNGIDRLMEQGGISSIAVNLIVLAGFCAIFTCAYVIIESSKKNRAVI